MYKRNIINFLFVLGFPVYGLGAYISASVSPSIGYLVSCSMHLLIILFYCVDLLYQRNLRIRVNMVYVLMLLFLLSSVASLFVALFKGLPDINMRLALARSVLVLAPFHAFIIFTLYNENHRENLPRLMLWGLSVLLVFNLAGYFGLGLTNQTHSIEGRLNFPFLDSFYSGAGLISIINLMLLAYLPRAWPDVVRVSSLVVFFMVNLVLFYFINSRLATLIFIFLFVLYTVGLHKRGLYWLALFTVPILLSSSLLVYKVLQWPAFASIMQRVDIEDVTTFNGRAYLWKDAMDWLMYDQRGLLLGNGYRGQFFLDIIPDVVKLWNVEDVQHVHLHSTSLEILVSQGLIFFIVFCVVFYRIYTFYRQRHREKKETGSLFLVALFLLFIAQVDTFVHLDGLGALIFALLVSNAAVTRTSDQKTAMKVEQKPLPIKDFQAEELSLV